MHWLTTRLAALQARYQAWLQLRRSAEGERSQATQPANQARAEFLADLSNLVEEVAARRGIDAAFAAHEGLLVHCVGNQDTADALAAVAASVLHPAFAAARTLELGNLQQVVFAGTGRKLALLVVGELAIGVLAPVEVHLADVLSRPNHQHKETPDGCFS